MLLGWLFMPPTIKYKLDAGALTPRRSHRGDAGFDLYILSEVIIPSNSFVDVHTGVYLQMPAYTSCRITNRSSTFRTHGLDVREGIIDNGYTGELFIGVHNPQMYDVCLPKHTRIAQAIFFFNIAPLHWEYTSELQSSDGRGTAGFGSSGNGKK